MKLKRQIKKDLNIRYKKKLRDEHYNLFTQGLQDTNNCLEYTNLEALVLAQFMENMNNMSEERTKKSFSQQYQLQKGL